MEAGKAAGVGVGRRCWVEEASSAFVIVFELFELGYV